MVKIFFSSLFFLCITNNIKSQSLETFVHEGEMGISIGAGTYFGDLNTTANISHPKFAAGGFYRKQLNNYVGVRIAGNYTFLGYSDRYSKNPVQKSRNLSFNTNVWEISVSGDFNFFKFYPGIDEYSFTPYVGLGLGAFSFDPYAYLGGQKYYLRSIGTEGQGSPLYPNLMPYKNVAICIPIILGIKKALNEKITIFGEMNYRFTNTKYLDDVSGTYAPDAFPPDANGNPSIGYLLQDRSYEIGTAIGVKGRQRGNSQNDSYITIQLGISYNIQSYHCPTAK